MQPITVSTTPPGRCFLRIQWFTDANRAPAADFDGDGISNSDEVTIFGSHPFVNDGSDYDKDGLTDSQEVAAGTNPLRFDMPELRVMASWRDALIEDWRPGSPNDYLWNNISGRDVRARAYNTSSTPAPYPDPNPADGLNIRKDWTNTSRAMVLNQGSNIFAGNATSLLWNDLMPPAQPPAAFAWGDAVETGTSIGAWMLQSFSYASPVKVHTIRARAVRVYLKASRPMPILFRARFKVRKSTRDDPAGAYFTPPNVSPATYDRAIQPGSTESNTFEINPATDLAALPGSLGLNLHYTVHEVYYAITAEAFPFSGDPLPPPAVDADSDGLPDSVELNIGSDPQNSDTDGDGRADLLDYLSPWPGAYVIAGGPGGSGSAATPPPLAPEIPLIQSITRTGHTCPSSSFNGFGFNVNLSAAVTIWHWLNGSRYQTVANPPPDAITTIKNAWTPIPPLPPLPLMALNFPAPGVDAENGILNNMSINEMIMDVGPFGSGGIRTSYSSLRSYNYGTTSAPNYVIGGDALERKVRLSRSTATPSALSRSYLLVDRKKTDTNLTTWTVDSVTPVTLTIPANQTISNTIALAVPASVPPDPSKISRHEMALLPVEISLRATGKIEPPPENTAYADNKYSAGGTDILGPLPMGTGRSDKPGQAYTAPVQVIGKVPSLPGANWRWVRWRVRRSWVIQMNEEGTGWNVTHRSKEPYDDDIGDPKLNDNTPSQTGHIYIHDPSAMLPAVVPFTKVGDFLYEEKQFTYKIETNAGGVWIKAAELDVGQTIIAKHIAVSVDVAVAFQGVENLNQVRILDTVVTEAEVRSIVGGTLPITIAADATN